MSRCSLTYETSWRQQDTRRETDIYENMNMHRKTFGLECRILRVSEIRTYKLSVQTHAYTPQLTHQWKASVKFQRKDPVLIFKILISISHISPSLSVFNLSIGLTSDAPLFLCLTIEPIFCPFSFVCCLPHCLTALCVLCFSVSSLLMTVIIIMPAISEFFFF